MIVVVDWRERREVSGAGGVFVFQIRKYAQNPPKQADNQRKKQEAETRFDELDVDITAGHVVIVLFCESVFPPEVDAACVVQHAGATRAAEEHAPCTIYSCTHVSLFPQAFRGFFVVPCFRVGVFLPN